MPEGLVAIRFLLPLVGCVAALLVGWFITCDPNPFTMTTILAATVMCSVALSNPVLGVYLLIFTSGYLDLVKRLGILSDALSGIDVVVTLALAPSQSGSEEAKRALVRSETVAQPMVQAVGDNTAQRPSGVGRLRLPKRGHYRANPKPRHGSLCGPQCSGIRAPSL